MGLEIKTGQTSKKKLSKAGIIIIAAAVLLVIVVVVVHSAKSSKRQPVYTAVEQCVSVCEGSASALGADSEKMSDYADDIKKEKDPDKKAQLAADMASYLINLADDDAALRDELTGARNRVYVALKKYKN